VPARFFITTRPVFKTVNWVLGIRPIVLGDSDEHDWSAFPSPYRHAAGGFSSPAQQLPPTRGHALMIDVHRKTRADIDDGDDRRFEVAA
jgi:hypothetical protein